MKQVIVSCLLAIMLVSAALIAGCADEKRSTPTIPVTTAPPTQKVTVPYGEELKVSLDAPVTSEVYLTMTARANSRELGGGRSFMRLKVNGKDILAQRLVNKKLNFTYGGEKPFRTTYYSTNMSAWYLFFSPDFAGYENPEQADHILEGNAYVYKFDVSDIVNKGVPNEILIENIGDEVAAQYTNPGDIEFYKSASIIIDPIRLEGKGTEVVQITKEATPTRIIVGKKSVVTLTVKNDLPGSISDVEITDAGIPSGLSGKAVIGKLDKPVAPGGTYTTTYEVTAEKTGTYTLGSAVMTFADATGNYQKQESGTVTITVI
ncbi:MAG: hypothetical protein GYA23_10645 [Methanomicrobiales archaeon]|nr:hypothetical protein [Methanomicrobiales archaeon]